MPLDTAQQGYGSSGATAEGIRKRNEAAKAAEIRRAQKILETKKTKSTITNTGAGYGILPGRPDTSLITGNPGADEVVRDKPVVPDVNSQPITDTATDLILPDEQTQTEQDLQGAQSDLTEAKTSSEGIRSKAYNKLFGKDSSISDFYNPNISTVQDSISSVEESLAKLEGDIKTRLSGVGDVTEVQARRVASVERGALTSQLKELTDSYDSLTKGLELQKYLSTKEYDATVNDALDKYDMAKDEVSRLTDLNEEEKKSLQDALDTKAKAATASTKEVTTILNQAIDDITSAGVTPSAAFDQVVKDAMKMALEGKPVSEIKTGIYRAIQQNAQVKAYMDKRAKVKSGSAGSKVVSDDKVINAAAAGFDISGKTAAELTQEEAKAAKGGSAGGTWASDLVDSYLNSNK